MATYRWRWRGIWSDSAQRHVQLTIKFDENGKVLTPFRDIAKHTGWGWGEWQSVRHLKTSVGSCWDVSTPGHGGFILVTQQRLDEDCDKMLVMDLSASKERAASYGFPCGFELYVYEFEEDCNWAVLLYLDEIALNDYVRYRNTWAEKMYGPRSFKEDFVIPCMLRWNQYILCEEDRALAKAREKEVA